MKRKFFMRESIQPFMGFTTGHVNMGCVCPCSNPTFWFSKEDVTKALEEYAQILKEEMSEIEKRIQELKKKGD